VNQEQEHILTAIAQPLQPHLELGEARVEIAAKSLLGDAYAEVAVRGSDHARIDGHRNRGADG